MSTDNAEFDEELSNWVREHQPGAVTSSSRALIIADTKAVPECPSYADVVSDPPAHVVDSGNDNPPSSLSQPPYVAANFEDDANLD